ncbi:MAG: TfoX/Sxy family protein [Dehalococcoidia bacterium]|nr:TfoX/Sxy family protein [Dehalococcoidia bacterium]
MAYDKKLAQRVRRALADKAGVVEKAMFGGVCFMVHGNMCCGVANDDLMVRVGPDAYEKTLKKPHARPMDFTGRALKGLVFVGPGGRRTDEDIKAWLDQGLEFVQRLPKKK